MVPESRQYMGRTVVRGGGGGGGGLLAVFGRFFVGLPGVLSFFVLSSR